MNNIEGDADPKRFIPYNLGIDMFGGIFINIGGAMSAKDSEITICMAFGAVRGDHGGLTVQYLHKPNIIIYQQSV